MKNKDRYDLRELANTLLYNNSCDVVIKYDGKDIFYGDENTLIQNFKNILRWLEQDYSLLDEKEKAYLSAVIRPWREQITYIAKCGNDKYQFIDIEYKDAGGCREEIELPCFESNTMYQGMELGREYSLEELGL